MAAYRTKWGCVCMLFTNFEAAYRVRCTQIHGPSTILLGDAAHAVTPIGGQGCNAALEDGLVLDQVLQSSGTPSLSPKTLSIPSRGVAFP